MRERRSLQGPLGYRKKIGGNHALFSDNKLQVKLEKFSYIVMYFKAFKKYCLLIISEKCVVTPNFLFG